MLSRTGYNISYRQETQEEMNYNPAPTVNNGKRNVNKSANRAPKSVLSFTHVFNEGQDTCFFAFCHPYSYSDLQKYLFLVEGKLEQEVALAALSPRAISPRYAKVPATKECSDASVSHTDPSLLFYHRTKLCNTIAGNRCDLLVISSLDNVHLEKDGVTVGSSLDALLKSQKSNPARVATGPISYKQPSPPLSRSTSASSRPSSTSSNRFATSTTSECYPIPGISVPGSVPHIIISARVHPGETAASWGMQGFLDFILSSHYKAQELRQNFIFLIVPMLNPDGVINGNNRTSLSGHDLNRNWRCPDPERHPTIYNLKEIAQFLVNKTSHDVLLYLDLHGHSRQKGVFTYGCLPDRNDIQVRQTLIIRCQLCISDS